MGNYTEQETYTENVPQVEISDPVAGGASGPVNLMGKAIANRTKWLKAQVDSLLNRATALENKFGSGSLSDGLMKVQNLADLPDKAASRTNLGVPSLEHTHDANYLKINSNLADLDNALTARTNLGVADIHFVTATPAASLGKNGDVAIQSVNNATSIFWLKQNGAWIAQIPAQATELPGVVKSFAGATCPVGYLVCNGQAVSRSTYAALFAAIGTTYGLGDGATTFNVPDIRGLVIRGYDGGRGVDLNRAFGSTQDGQNKAHAHGLDTGRIADGGGHEHTASTGGAGGHAHQYGDIYWSEHGGSVYTGGFGQGDGNDNDNKGYEIERTTGAIGNHTHAVSVGNAGTHTHPLRQHR